MARPLRIEYPGAVYHVTSRGNAGHAIFLDDGDRRSFLDVLGSAVQRFNSLCHAFCLMENHYHVLIETPEGNLSRGMRQLNGVYTQAFNRRHRTGGHIFQGRYKAIVVDKESYLLELCRYVVLNPVRARMVKSPEAWNWSSYAATAGIRKRPSYLTVDWILGQFSTRKEEARRRYRQFVLSGIREGSPWGEVKGQVFLGREGFIEHLQSFFAEREGIREVPRAQRYAYRPLLEELLTGETIGNRKQRNRPIYEAHVTFGYTLKEIANHLGTHYTTVSKAIKGVEEGN